MENEAPEKLVRLDIHHVKPIKYTLIFDPDMNEDTFKGHLEIEIQILRTINRIILHSYKLEYDSILLSDGTTHIPCHISEAPDYIQQTVQLEILKDGQPAWI